MVRTATLRALKPGKSIVDCPAHNLELSIEEFGKWGQEYPFHHMTDPALFNILTRFVREADIVMTQSKQSIGYLEALGIHAKRYEVIPGGTLIPPEIPPFLDQFNVGYLGACGPDKGQIYLIDGWAKLGLKDCQLILAGDGTDTLEPTLEPYKDKADYNLVGRIEDIADFYKAISVYVQPSVTEGFGLPVLEAMAHGRPVICSQGAGAHELIEEGRDGFIVPIRDPDAIAERIKWLYDNPSQLRVIGENARRKAEQYPWLRAKMAYERLIKE